LIHVADHREKVVSLETVETLEEVAMELGTAVQRLWSEEERQASEERYRALLNLGAEVGEAIIMMCDTEQGEAIQIFVNDEWPRITGYSKEELLGMSFFDLVHPGSRQTSIDRHRRKMAGKSLPGLYELPIIRKDGTKAPIELTSAYTTYRGERANVAYIRDITERKRAERKLKGYRDHLKEMVDKRTAELRTINEQLFREIAERKGAEEKTEELYKLERKLRRKLEIQKEQRVKFTKTLVHELKTPLTPMRAASELLIAESREDSQLSLANTINRGVLNLDRRIDELLDLAKGGVGILKLKYRLADPLQLLYEVADYVAPEAAKNGHSLALDLPASLSTLWCDQDRLRQVVLNLLSNAFKFTPEGGRVTLRAKQKDDTLIVEVQDTGCGISDDKKQQLFKPYDQVEGDQEQFSGLGVGLALCKILVELHGGQIWVESQNGKGSSFIFTVPSKTKGL
jgi:PAS domain S-box-containing protein